MSGAALGGGPCGASEGVEMMLSCQSAMKTEIEQVPTGLYKDRVVLVPCNEPV
ncbi:hypothetical protein ABT255_26465 [Streptomyces mirabilis]|uniref:hypothetical protein n=1 Tax=Streptomyces mirabilis TaxID=68239 RepID=UPI00332D8C58